VGFDCALADDPACATNLFRCAASCVIFRNQCNREACNAFGSTERTKFFCATTLDRHWRTCCT
jgi:hypothetical protein